MATARSIPSTPSSSYSTTDATQIDTRHHRSMIFAPSTSYLVRSERDLARSPPMPSSSQPPPKIRLYLTTDGEILSSPSSIYLDWILSPFTASNLMLPTSSITLTSPPTATLAESRQGRRDPVTSSTNHVSYACMLVLQPMLSQMVKVSSLVAAAVSPEDVDGHANEDVEGEVLSSGDGEVVQSIAKEDYESSWCSYGPEVK